ncbi:hypothetical protein QAD02_023725 [Eretmocerus hayati]|uniref:Uncharacterized protein n=1 Tax=Eretmocerus hayati TaxID=131215 RepID=A0ACC2Q1J1_9HYME|nr:hypothetical protein QAD02_023725 [Eretmocerus hayati]
MAPLSGVPKWALVNYLVKNMGDKSLQIVEVDDIKNFNPLTFAPDRKDPKIFLFSVALLNNHKEKVYHAAERLRESGADDIINERDGEVPPNKKLKVQDRDNCAAEKEPLISGDDGCDYEVEESSSPPRLNSAASDEDEQSSKKRRKRPNKKKRKESSKTSPDSDDDMPYVERKMKPKRQSFISSDFDEDVDKTKKNKKTKKGKVQNESVRTIWFLPQKI